MSARSLIIHTFNYHKSSYFTRKKRVRKEKNNVTTAIKCCEIISCLYSLLCAVHGCMHYTFFYIDYSTVLHTQNHAYCTLMGNFKDFKVNDNSVFALNPDFITQPLSKIQLHCMSTIPI